MINKLILDNKEYELNDSLVQQLKEVVNVPVAGGRWVPQDDEEYWTILGNGKITNLLWCNDEYDQWRLTQNLVFKTETEVKHHKRYLEAVAEVRASSDFVPDWNDPGQEKITVAYNYRDKCLTYSVDYIYAHSVIVYYASMDEYFKAISDHKAAWLTIYGVEG